MAAKYERLSVNSDEDFDASLDILKTSPEVYNWRNAERRRKLKSLLYVAIPALSIGGLILMMLGNTGTSDATSTLSAPGERPFVNSGWQRFRATDESPHLKRLSAAAVPRSEQEAVFSPGCTDLWISKGKLCDALTSDNYPLRDIERLSVVHTWQNGSDPRQSEARAAAQGDTSHGNSGTAIKHFRSHNVSDVLHAHRCPPSECSSVASYRNFASAYAPYCTHSRTSRKLWPHFTFTRQICK